MKVSFCFIYFLLILRPAHQAFSFARIFRRSQIRPPPPTPGRIVKARSNQQNRPDTTSQVLFILTA